MRILFAAIATFLLVLFFLACKKSSEYEYLVENLEGYLLSELYPIGFALMNMKFFAFKNKLLTNLIKKSTLIYGQQYAEYYANITLAEAFTFISVICIVGFAFGAIVGGTGALVVLVIAAIAGAGVWNFSVLSISDAVKERSSVCLREFPDMVTKFALLINSGMVLREAWFLVSSNGDSELYRLLRESCMLMNNGASDAEAILDFGIKTDTPEIKKFTSSMVQGIEKGNNELADFLLEQANEMSDRKRQMLLQEGEKAAGKLILPIAITFLGIILIIGFSAMQSMSF